ncbi:MAG: DUF3307 domain-containing protein [bacterium]
MFVFYRLLLAHFIADYPMQWSAFLRWKVKSIWGKAVHSGLHVLVSILLLIPYWNTLGLWTFMLILFLTHFFQDWLKIFIFHGKKSDDVFTFLMDQVLHFIVLALVLLFPFAKEVRHLPALGALYNNTIYIIVFTGIFAATYAGSVLLYYLKKTFIDERSGFDQGYDGMGERAAIFFLVLLGGYYWFLIPLAVFFKVIFYFSNVLQVRPGFDIILGEKNTVVRNRTIERKGEIAMDLMASPAWAIITALVVQGLAYSLGGKLL